jgi:polysaccharide export outer membrane protein
MESMTTELLVAASLTGFRGVPVPWSGRAVSFCFLPLLLAMIGMFPPAIRASGFNADGFSLQPGDMVRIVIWRGGDLGGDYPIDEDGNLHLPLIGTIPVEDMSTDSLKFFLIQNYARYLRDPFITVVPLFRINVMGEVAHPGLYPVDATLGLFDILSLAGGAKESGDLDKIMVIQDGRFVSKNLREELEGKTPVEKFGIKSGDQIIVGKKGGISVRDWAIVASIVSASALMIDVISR